MTNKLPAKATPQSLFERLGMVFNVFSYLSFFFIIVVVIYAAIKMRNPKFAFAYFQGAKQMHFSLMIACIINIVSVPTTVLLQGLGINTVVHVCMLSLSSWALYNLENPY